ncbi:MAG: type II toxin-antitoxin system VapB family antitoxin [Elusimicrobiota bacterium]
MRTTLIIDDITYKKAAELTGIKEKTSLVRIGLETLISKESSKRLSQLGGSEGQLKHIKRRRVGR